MDALADRIERFAQTPYAFDNRLVSAIDYGLAEHVVDSLDKFHRAMKKNCTFKVRAMEKFNLQIRMICEHLRVVYDHEGPLTCAAHIATPDSPSFDWQSDTDGLWLKVIRGSKQVQYDNGVDYTVADLRFNYNLYITAGTRYRMFNKEDSVILVFSLERFMEDIPFFSR